MITAISPSLYILDRVILAPVTLVIPSGAPMYQSGYSKINNPEPMMQSQNIDTNDHLYDAPFILEIPLARLCPFVLLPMSSIGMPLKASIVVPLIVPCSITIVEELIQCVNTHSHVVVDMLLYILYLVQICYHQFDIVISCLYSFSFLYKMCLHYLDGGSTGFSSSSCTMIYFQVFSSTSS